MPGLDKPVDVDELWCLKSTGFAATGGAMSFYVYRSRVADDPVLTRRAFEIGLAARGGGIALAGFPADRIFWSTDTVMFPTRQNVACNWGMEFVEGGIWWTAVIGTPRRMCAEGRPSDTALRFFNSVHIVDPAPQGDAHA